MKKVPKNKIAPAPGCMKEGQQGGLDDQALTATVFPPPAAMVYGAGMDMDQEGLIEARPDLKEA